MNILFNTIWTRNVGFSTIDLGKLLPGLRVIMPIMMFIGSAPVKDSVILFRLT
jgi:Cation transport protein.